MSQSAYPAKNAAETRDRSLPRKNLLIVGAAAATPSTAHPSRMLCNSDDSGGADHPGEVCSETQAIESHSVNQMPGAPAIAHQRKMLASRLASGRLRQTKLYPLMAAAIPHSPSSAAGTLTRENPSLQ